MGLAENRSNPAADGSYLRGEEPYAVRVGRAGGCDRAGARYAIGLNVDQSRFPWATLTIYLSGALLLGLFLTEPVTSAA